MPQEKKLTILFVTNNYTPYSGGVVSSIQSTTHELQKRGHNVQIVTLDFARAKINDPDFVTRIPCPVKFRYKTNPMAAPWRPSHNLLSITKKIKPDIIHTHHPFLLGSSAVHVANELDIPIIFTYHTLYEYYAHYIPLPLRITQWALKQIVPSFCNKVDGIIAPSSMIKSMLDDLNICKPVIILPSGLQEPFLPAKTFENKHLHKPFHLLHVGRFVQEKNVQFILDLMPHLTAKQFALTMIGYGELFDELQDYAYKTLQLSTQQVRFIYKPDKTIIAQAYNDADLFLFSSFSDTQALVLAESMAAGTPVVALDGPGQRDIIIQGKNGFIAHDAGQMITFINEITHDKSMYKNLQHNAWLTAQHYTPEHITQQLLEFYERIMDNCGETTLF